MSWLWGKPKKKGSYRIKAEKKAKDHLRKRLKVASKGRTLKKAPISHGPADWEVVDSTARAM